MVSSLSAAMSEAEAAAAMQSLLQQLAPSISNGDKISGLPGSWSAELAADASSGVLAGLIDGLAVRIPEAMTAGSAGSAADTVAGPGGSGGRGGGGQGGGHRQSGSNLPHLQLLPRLATDTPQVLRTAMFWRSSTAAAQENDAPMVTLDSRLGVRIFATDAGCAASLLKPPVCVTWRGVSVCGLWQGDAAAAQRRGSRPRGATRARRPWQRHLAGQPHALQRYVPTMLPAPWHLCCTASIWVACAGRCK